MNYDEYLLDVAAEECADIAQRISEALRFSLGEVQPGQALTNAERIVGELVDLKAMVEMLEERGLIDCAPLHDRSLIAAKKAKVEKFSAYSERSEEHTSELQSLMRISYAVFCLKKQILNKQSKH